MRLTTDQFGKLIAVIVLWLFLAGLCALMLWPHLPQTWLHWVVFVVVAPPLYVLVEALGAWVFSEKHGRAISSNQFSAGRISFAIVVVLVAVAFSWWASAMVQT